MTDATSDAPVPRPANPTVPRWVNPWVISFVLGAVAITLTRSKTRYIPDAPPVLAPAPAILVAPMGHPEAAKGVRLYGFIAPGEPGKTAAAAIESLAAKFAAAEAPVTVVAIPTAGVGAITVAGVVTLPLTPADQNVLTQFLATTARQLQVPAAEPWQFGLLLVDSSGGFRGFFSTAEWGVDEILHRAQHVLREEQKK